VLIASAGDTVIVECGTYYEHDIAVPPGVFLKSETGDPACVTIDGLGLGTVFLCSPGGAGGSFEGLTITGGNGDYGGGMRCWSTSPSLSHVVFASNSALGGGAVSISGGAAPVLTDVVFERNSARDGGAMTCDGHATSPVLIDCVFTGNEAARYGGGMDCFDFATPGLTNTLFDGNTAADHGGGIYCDMAAAPGLSGVVFVGDSATKGGGMMCEDHWVGRADADGAVLGGDSSREDPAHRRARSPGREEPRPTLTDCVFSGNDAREGGGMRCRWGYAPCLTGCEFAGNTATFGGGLMVDADAHLTAGDCTFSENVADNGGALVLWDSSAEISGCTFVGNTGGWVGAMHVSGDAAAVTLDDCLFVENEDCALVCELLAPVVGTGLTFVRNGGGVACHLASPSFANVTFHGNGGDPACVNCDLESSPTFVNTIISGTSPGHAVECHDESLPTFVCCDLFGNAGGDWTPCIEDQAEVNGNFSADPLFCDAALGDLTLCEDSPCLLGNHPTGSDCGLIGACGQGCGPCGPSAVEAASWGSIKAVFR